MERSPLDASRSITNRKIPNPNRGRMSAESPIYRRSPEVVAANLGEKSFLLHFSDWVYLELNETGSAVWESMEDGSTLESMTGKIVKEFEVEPEVCFQDSSEFLQFLEEKHFVLAE
jgi:coenzyme PQQ synthesis protein D (PqqD)